MPSLPDVSSERAGEENKSEKPAGSVDHPEHKQSSSDNEICTCGDEEQVLGASDPSTEVTGQGQGPVMCTCKGNKSAIMSKDLSLCTVQPHSTDTGGDLLDSSIQLLDRFKQLGDLNNLQQAIMFLENIVGSTPAWDDRYAEGQGCLGLALWYRFNRLGQLCDIEDAISRQKRAIDLTHDGSSRALHISNLGNCLRARFERLGKLGDIEDAVSRHKDAADLTPYGHPDRSMYLINLGNAFLTRFHRLGELTDLENAVLSHKDAINLIPHDHPDRPGYLSNLCTSLAVRFQQLGELVDLDDAILTLRSLVEVTPHDHPNKPKYLGNLGTFLTARFKRLGELSDLDDAVSVLKHSVDLIPHDHPDKLRSLSMLGDSLKSRFERLGELNDLEESIVTFRNIIGLTPRSHPNLPGDLSCLGNSLVFRFERIGELNDLDDAISLLEDSVSLIPHGHPVKSTALNNLGTSFKIRFEHLGKLGDLEKAILTLINAVSLTPDEPRLLANLGNALAARFEHFGELSDLEDAILRHKKAVDLIPDDHALKSDLLSKVGVSLLRRFEHHRQLLDLEHAISALRDAVSSTPQDHPNMPHRLNSLGVCLRSRFECLGELHDLEDAVSVLRTAVDLTPNSSPYKPSNVYTLGQSLIVRFTRLRDPRDLEEGISRYRDAVDLTPTDAHPKKPRRLNALGKSFLLRFDLLGELDDLQNAISNQCNAISLTPHGHQHKASYLVDLGDALRARFARFGKPTDLDKAISLYFHASSSPVGPAWVRLLASRNWISCARHTRHHTLLHAYSIAISLLPQVAWVGLSLSGRYAEIRASADLAREAAAVALDSGLPEIAVEWLEQGRSIVWGELFQLRSSYEELSSVHPDHAQRLRELSTALENATATEEQSLSEIVDQQSGTSHHVVESFYKEAERHRSLAIERDSLLRDIRRLPGFEQFLLRKQFSQLRASAHSGPVVILNTAEGRCDALIVLSDVDHVIHVPLQTLTLERSMVLQNMLETLLGHAREICSENREGKRFVRTSIGWESLLSNLWHGVVKPVLSSLAISTPGELSRMFWCPTGPFVFLPIHGAGVYDTEHSQPGHKVSDFVVSSYTPSLSILTLSSSSNLDTTSRGDLCLLAIRQSPSDGFPPLPGVATEFEYINSVIRNAPSACITLLEFSDGTVEEVLSLMKKADWVHFACHGVQDDTDSGLCLANRRRLKLRDIIALSRPHGGLAFLSACQTAMGDERLADEAVHIAAGMLFAGYGGVIGTMWSISDTLAPRVARDVYAHLLQNGTRPDYREAAQALHETIRRVRESGDAPFATWLPFIHVGL